MKRGNRGYIIRTRRHKLSRGNKWLGGNQVLYCIVDAIPGASSITRGFGKSHTTYRPVCTGDKRIYAHTRMTTRIT